MKNKYTIFLIILLVAGFAWRLAFSWRSIEQLTNFPVIDDCFYSLNIARNIALGKGMTCDGINPTNGFQPLFVFLAIPIYWLFPADKILPLNLVLSLMSVISVFTGFFVYKLIKLLTNEKAALFAVLLWCLSPTIIEFELNGLETGLYVFLLAVTSYFYLAYIRGKTEAGKREFALLGGLLGLTILTRIDGLFFFMVMGLDFLWLNRKRLQEIIKPVLVLVLFCCLIAGPWFVHNLYRFGNAMPVSGQAVRLLSLSSSASRFYEAGEQFPINPIPWGYYLMNIKKSLVKMGRAPIIEAIFWPGLFLGYNWLGYGLFLFAVGGIICLVLVYRTKAKEYLARSGIAQLSYTIPFCIIMLLAYCFYVFGQWYYVRYYFPILFISILYSGFIYDLSINHLLSNVNKTFATGVNVVLIVFLVVTLNYRVSERYFAKAAWTEGKHHYYPVAKWINENMPADAKIGSFQSGTFAYFTEHQLINLDGVVNQDAFEAMRDKRMLEYIESSGIEYVLDWQWMIDDYLWKASNPSADRAKLQLLQEDIFGYKLYKLLRD